MNSPAGALALLERPLVAVVSTAGRTPHAVPVWFRYASAGDYGTFWIWSDRSRAWVRRLERDPNVQLVVAESEPPFAAILARGRATLEHRNVLDEAHRICERYLAPADTPAYLEAWRHLDTIVTIEVESLRGWDRGY